MTITTLIEQLESQLNVDVDSMEPSVAKGLPFKPHNMTSNQLLVNEQMLVPENREMFLRAVKDYKNQGWEATLDRIVRRILPFALSESL
jgi:transaldolase